MPGTRRQIFQQLHEWADAPDGPNIFWLSGSPGAGKSAIATTFAKELMSRGRLGAQFYFQHGVHDAKEFWRTIAFYLAQPRPFILEEIAKFLASPARPNMENVDDQFEELVEKPLKAHPCEIPLVIVLDALDECSSPDALMGSLRKWAASSVPCKLFVTSRPEHEIKISFSTINAQHDKLNTGDAVDEATSADIRNFVNNGLKNIVDNNRDWLPESWPNPADIDKIVNYSAGLFIWAATVIRHISGKREGDRARRWDSPAKLLAEVVSGEMTAGDINRLYRTILGQRFGESPDRVFEACVGTIVTSKIPLSHLDVWKLSGQDEPEELWRCLNELSSVISRAEDSTFSVHHQSFADFLHRFENSGPFFVEKTKYDTRLAKSCLRLMNEGLKFDMFNFPSSYLSNEDHLEQAPGVVEDNISSYLLYSCRSWGEHLLNAVLDGALLPALKTFLDDHILHWLEVMSLTKQLGYASVSLNLLADVCQV
jgi:hypothetical protein